MRSVITASHVEEHLFTETKRTLAGYPLPDPANSIILLCDAVPALPIFFLRAGRTDTDISPGGHHALHRRAVEARSRECVSRLAPWPAQSERESQLGRRCQLEQCRA